jgi:putative peptidoglycan lipid II flippase
MFMLGLPAFTLYFVLQRGWYAMEDTRTPFVFAVLTNVVIVLMALLLFNRAEPGAAQVSALALAYSIGYVITLLVAWPALLRGYGTLDSRRTVVTLGKLAFAGAGAYVIGLAVSGLLGLTFELGDSRMIAALDLTITSAVIVVAFTLLALLARVAELKELLAWGAGPLRRLTGKVRSR